MSLDSLGTLQRLGGGHMIEELCEALVATAEEVVATKKTGSVSLTLKITKSIGEELAVIITETIKRSSPARGERGAMFFALDGQLHREDPRQIKMELRAVDGQSELRVSEDRGIQVREATS